MGVHGYGTDQQLLRLEKLGLSFYPDLVALGFFDENPSRNTLSFRDYAKPRFEWHGGELKNCNSPVPTPHQLAEREPMMPTIYLLGLLTNVVDRFKRRTIVGPPPKETPEWWITRAILDKMRRTLEKRHIRFLVVYIPPAARLNDLRLRNTLADWCRENGVSFCSLSDAFATLSDEARQQVYRGHLSPMGNDEAAKAIASAIEQGHLLE